MVIRSAQEKDIPQIIQMKKWGTEKDYLERIEKTKTGEADYLVAEENGQVLGHVFLKYYGSPTEPDYPDVEDLYVKEALRGKGIGSMLMEECEKRVQEKGFNKIGLGVNPDLNSKAKALYERLGYKNVGKPPYLDAVYNGTEDWVIDMVKELG